MEEKLSTKIYMSIRNDIINGVIDARTFLTESELAVKFGVSKAPVRDALHLLCNQEYLISYPRKGYMVALQSTEEARHMQEVRTHLEKMSIALAIQNATDAEILSLKSIPIEDRSSTDPDQSSNTRFHIRLAEISHNSYLPTVVGDLLRKIARVWVNRDIDLSDHDQIVDAMLERDTEKATALLLKDLNRAN